MLKIDLKHTYAFSAPTVFTAFLGAESAQYFMFRTDNGKLISAKVTPELGGEFVFIEQRGDAKAEHYGSFVELEPAEKLSFVFSTEKESTDSSYVELFFSKTTTGCQIRLVQEVTPEHEKYLDKINAGWTSILSKLEKYLNTNELKTAPTAVTKDSQGQLLSEGDTVKTIKDLKVKGSSLVVKRGTVVKNIRLLSDSPDEIDCKVDGVGLHLETQWLLKM